jgi:hypothetical protein
MTTHYTIQQLRDTLAWAKANPTQQIRIHFADWTKQIYTGTEWRQWFRQCLDRKISRSLPVRGRKEEPDWQRAMRYAQRQLNHPRLCIDWLPPELRQRFAHRLRQPA